MTELEKIHCDNERALELAGFYLNYAADFIDEDTLTSITGGDDGTRDYAYAALMATACGLDTSKNDGDREIFRRYFIPMISELRSADYKNDAYYRNIKVDGAKKGCWELRRGKYNPYEAFVYDDLEIRRDGRLLPHIGYFSEEFEYPEVLESGRQWMSVTPNEINTMRAPLAAAHGKVLTFGLGLGYFTYMASEKTDVIEVTAVERDESVIKLFETEILPQFSHREKVRIVHGDAFEFADRELTDGGYDFVFTDLWHDASDGIELYLEMKKREKLIPARFEYWIEKTLRCYIGDN